MHVGPGKKGKDIRSHFAGIPCGWPQDSVDAALVLLTLTEHLQAQHNEKAVQARQLDQSKIGPAQFRVENRPLTAGDKVKLRKLFQAVGINCKPNEEVTAADRFCGNWRIVPRRPAASPRFPPGRILHTSRTCPSSPAMSNWRRFWPWATG